MVQTVEIVAHSARVRIAYVLAHVCVLERPNAEFAIKRAAACGELTDITMPFLNWLQRVVE